MQWILWVFMAIQLVGWGWGSAKAGNLTDRQHLVWCVAMICGQVAAGIETLIMGAYGAAIMQLYFFLTTVFSGIKRWRQMKRG